MSSLRSLLAGLLLVAAPCPALAARGANPATKQAKAFVSTLRHPTMLLSTTAPESKAVTRRGVQIRGRYRSVQKSTLDGKLVMHTLGKAQVHEGIGYREFPNSTALTTVDPRTGKQREFLIARGVRDGYENTVTLETGSQSPAGYVSDVLLFEKVGGQVVYRSRLLASHPEASFLFEDPRISSIHDGKNGRRIFLSGTDYAPHVKGSADKDVMNRYVELALDHTGQPKPVVVGEDRRPKFMNLSPAPLLGGKGEKPLFVDSKNGTMYQNELGQIVVRTRMRPDFKDPRVQALAGDKKWSYGEQVFVFEDLAHLQAYDFRHALSDLFGKHGDEPRVRPLESKVLLTEHQLVEQFDDARVMQGHHKGMGPGTTPVRLSRVGDALYLSEDKHGESRLVGTIPKAARAGFPVAAGEVKYVSFDHEIRYFKDQRGGAKFQKRHYSMAVKLFDPTLTKIEAYYADVVQPKRMYERGRTSGIVDLHHVYPMGRTLGTDARGKPTVRVYGGASDAHTPLYEFDVMKLLVEMSAGGKRRASGQVYVPGAI